MNKKDLWKLRCEITLNSLFLADYKNSFGINEDDVYTFFEGYFEELEYMLKDNIGEEKWKQLTSREETEEILKLDTEDNLYNYYYGIENNPF